MWAGGRSSKIAMRFRKEKQGESVKYMETAPFPGVDPNDLGL